MKLQRFSLAVFILLAACAAPNAATPTQILATSTLEVPAVIRTATEVTTTRFTLDSVELEAEQLAAMKAHPGLEQSIVAVEGGKFTASVTVLNQENQPVVQSMEVSLSTLAEDLTSKNEYGNTPVITAVDNKMLIWVQEHPGWYLVERSTDIHNPVLIPVDKPEIALRQEIVSNPEAFSQAALDRWNAQAGLIMGYQYVDFDPNVAGDGARFAYLGNKSISEDGLTPQNTPIQIIDSWYAFTLADGTKFRIFPTKWLDPRNPLAPEGDEWKIIFSAVGPEVMGDEFNRNQFDNLLNMAAAGNAGNEVVPIIRADDQLFTNVNYMITLQVNQPSLAKLLKLPGNDFGQMINPHSNFNEPFSYWLDHYFPTLSEQNFAFGDGLTKDNKDYDTSFFPSDIQTKFFPTIILLKP